jgi:predicted alpha/beta superfamily hydrolase
VTDWQDYPAKEGDLREVAGRLKVWRDIESPEMANRRDILVLLPQSHANDRQSYPVVYMHDGQNLFDTATSFAHPWHVPRTTAILAREGLEVIIVGIPNAGPKRIEEYSPFSDNRIGGGGGDAYLDFITDVIKPEVDRRFRTKPARDSTFIAGSSMGGLISLWAFFTRPEVFGGVAALSPALWFARRSIFRRLEALPSPPGRLYVDGGTAEGPMLLSDVARLRDLLVEKGYRAGRDLRFVIDRDGAHDETSWGRRLPAILRFLLGARPGDQAPAGEPAEARR